MKLHRLRLRNFRGVQDRECLFADRGVTVVSGRNEAGKSSMVEALDLLLDVPSSSKSRRAQAVQPAGRDVGTEVEAEISCGPWRFTYAKTFNKGQSTSLIVHEPHPEQHTGKAAHDRATEILGESVDLALLHASRVVQDGDGAAVAMSDSASVTRALDRAVADQGDDPADGEDGALLAAVEAEFAKYYTAGRAQPTGELLEAQRREKAARTLLAELDAALASVDEDVEALERLSGERKRVESAQEQLGADLEAAEDARRAAYGVRDRTEKAESAAEAARLRHEKLLGEQQTRRRASAKIEEIAAAKAAAMAERTAADAAAAHADAGGEELEAARVAAEAALADAREAVATAEAQEQRAAVARKLAAATDRVSRAEAAHRALADAERALTDNTVDAAVLARARALRDELVSLTAQVDAAATTLRVVRLGGQPVLVDGADAPEASIPVVGETVVEVPGVARIELRAPSAAVDLDARRDDRAAQLDGLCVAHGADDGDALIGLGEARLALEPRVAAARADLDRILGGATLDDLRATVADLREQVGDAQPVEDPPDLAALRAAERESAAAHLAAERAVAAHEGRRARLTAAAEHAAAAVDRHERELDELVAAQTAFRAVLSDAALDADVAAGAERAESTAAAARQLRAELAAADLAEVENRVEVLDSRIAALAAEHTEIGQRLAQARARIDLCREDARTDRREEAAAAHAAARAELDRVTARARAAQTLRAVLNDHRSAAHARFSEPFRRHLEDLARPLFGDDVRFDVDDQLGITARTLDDATVSFDELSVGAREQIGIIARLACAMLVDEADGVPVIIDDALGHSDSERVAQMAQVLTRAGEHAQVIVLTCAPERYREVATARTVAL
ncbi:MAG: AAA family ATPase [Gordonia sp. (in: high G+C Gram-positive bacteria)]|uniref:AAA family ATPase n=1 Tax=Gordonia sp. (in: high G+C Gram-positive bacteria) TaxID=84139 RepID=UPI0039E30363